MDVCQKKYIENSILYVGGSYVVCVEEDLFVLTSISLSRTSLPNSTMATPHNHPHFSAYNQPIHAKPFSFSSQHPNASRDASGPSFIHRCLPHSHRGQRPFTSEAVCRPFSSCSCYTDIQTHSYGRELTVDKAVALERPESDQ